MGGEGIGKVQLSRIDRVTLSAVHITYAEVVCLDDSWSNDRYSELVCDWWNVFMLVAKSGVNVQWARDR